LISAPAALAVVVLLVAGGAVPSDARQAVIVLLDQPAHAAKSQAGRIAQELGARYGWTATHLYEGDLPGFAARLTATDQVALLSEPGVAAIHPDEEIELIGPDANEATETRRGSSQSLTGSATPAPTQSPTPAPTPSPTPRPALPTPGTERQIVPVGVKRVGRPALDVGALAAKGEPADVDIAVVDTGVSAHRDLNLVGGKNCTGGGNWSDENGHGTHVAGTAAARDNGIGVIGVAPGARIWSVKVLDKSGRGYASWLLCGIDWISRQRESGRPLIEVANLSLRFRGIERPGDDGDCGNTIGDAVHRAICHAVEEGTVFVVAAGNDGKKAANYRPAAYREVITVSALSDFDGRPGGRGEFRDACPSWSTWDRDDRFADFSNYGKAVTIMAPGKCIWSTNNNGRYRQMSGTSMATPHVAGAVAMYLLFFPDASPAQVKRSLIACGTDDWFHGSDPDDNHEPLLNVAALCAPQPP
jgi:hypothetical protein